MAVIYSGKNTVHVVKVGSGSSLHNYNFGVFFQSITFCEHFKS